MDYRTDISQNILKRITLFVMLVSVNYTIAQESGNIITFDVGSFSVTVLSEGQQQGNKDILIGATEEMLKLCIPDGTFPNAVNTFLVETGDKTVLFDTGYGRKLFDNLKAYGKTAADIHAILLTHMHGDHIGGLLRNMEKTFPAAKLYIPKPEYDYWMSEITMQQNGSTQIENIIEAYKDKLHLFTPGETEDAEELLPGICSIATYGHTPGHTGYMLESNGSKMFIWGDLVHAMAIQMPYPEVAVTYDTDPVKAVESRRKLLKYLSDQSIQIAGMHIEFPAIGNIKEKPSGGYDFTLTCSCEGR